MTTSEYAIAALFVSTIALIVATRNYRRKSGLLVRGSFQITSSVDCDDRYVSMIVLENLKDRATTIFAIYLEVDHGYYIEVEDFHDKPLLLRAFETYQREFGPIQLYGVNTSRINVNKLLADANTRKRLVLSTSDGKYVVPSPLKRWRPVSDFFANHMTAIIHPVRTSHKEKDIGSNIKYVIEFISATDTEEIVLVRHDDFLRSRKFRTFVLTKESLESKDALERYLKEQMDKGVLICKTVVVHDAGAASERAAEFYTGGLLAAERRTAIQYRVLGRGATWYANHKLARENTRRAKGQ